MDIAVTVDPEIPVPPTLYGGIERIADMVVRGLIQRGHEVTLFAHPESDVPCNLKGYPVPESRGVVPTLQNMRAVSTGVLAGGYDLIHSFGRLAYLLPLLPIAVPKLMSYQRSISPRSVAWGERLSRETIHFSGCSRHLIEPWKTKENWHVVYNGVPRDLYTFQPNVEEDAPLVFLGRVEKIKGTHLAIDVAKRSGESLIIAGNVSNEHRTYFEDQIEPRIDGKQIQFVGSVGDDEKDDLLGSAKAFLMPILWEEPFGIVMAEALACGTPVIGLKRGAVPEVVNDGVNGFVCVDVDEMVKAVGRVDTISRGSCRRVMEERFSDRAVVDAYEDLYRKLLST
jgi:glycosyltransferase involved in cell wall biosynthesis